MRFLKRLLKVLKIFPRNQYLKALRKVDAVKYARVLGVKCGEGCNFVNPNFGAEPYLLSFGDNVSVAKDVHFITHDGGVWVFRKEYPDIDVIKPIKIGSNVLIGLGAILMPGVTIGDYCVIGAGSVVTRDIPSGSVAAGVPAKVIKTTDQYYESVKEIAMHIRSLPVKEKRKILLQKFGMR